LTIAAAWALLISTNGRSITIVVGVATLEERTPCSVDAPSVSKDSASTWEAGIT
jgi:hypothetical protein